MTEPNHRHSTSKQFERLIAFQPSQANMNRENIQQFVCKKRRNNPNVLFGSHSFRRLGPLAGNKSIDDKIGVGDNHSLPHRFPA
jgi:hypothetical protein